MKDKYKVIICIMMLCILISFTFIFPNNSNMVIPNQIINSTCLDCGRNAIHDKQFFEFMIYLLPFIAFIAVMFIFIPNKNKQEKSINYETKKEN